jgi:hypothetical protein
VISAAVHGEAPDPAATGAPLTHSSTAAASALAHIPIIIDQPG